MEVCDKCKKTVFSSRITVKISNVINVPVFCSSGCFIKWVAENYKEAKENETKIDIDRIYKRK